MSRMLLVAVGGLIGSILRYWLAGVVQQSVDSEFPIGTLAVNLIGSFVIGVVISASVERGLLSAEARLLLATGFCGGFTTMSTFSYETLALLRDGETAYALGNVGGSILGCLAATWLGQTTGRLL
jgi:CrcB protein